MGKEQWLVLATRNRGKTREIGDLLRGFPVAVKNLEDFGPIPEVEEDGTTFEENAYKKASFTAKVLGVPAMADDSGLEVTALGGAPGVYSARYAGPGATDEENNAKLLGDMSGKADRAARFVCAISIAVPCGVALTYEGRCEGRITTAPQGTEGFGYDPLFFYPPLAKTFAQLSAAEKNRISHRGRALSEVQEEFDKVLAWIHRHL